MKNLANELKKNVVRPLYLFYGGEYYLINHYLRELLKLLSSGDAAIDSMNTNRFEDGETTSGDVIELCETMPFMADRRVIIVWRRGYFSAGKKDESERFAEYFLNLPETSVLVFVEDEADKRGRAYKNAAKYGLCVEFAAQDSGELTKWLANIAKSKGAAISGSAAALLLRTVGTDMTQLSNEITKLADYAAPNEILPADVNLLCVKSTEARIFEMVEAISRSDAKKALEVYDELIQNRQQPIMILGMIARQFRIMIQCRLMSEAGTPQKTIEKMLNLRDFIVRDGTKYGRNFPEKTLLSGLASCRDTDARIKTGAMGDRLAVEMLVAGLCSGRNSN